MSEKPTETKSNDSLSREEKIEAYKKEVKEKFKKFDEEFPLGIYDPKFLITDLSKRIFL